MDINLDEEKKLGNHPVFRRQFIVKKFVSRLHKFIFSQVLLNVSHHNAGHFPRI